MHARRLDTIAQAITAPHTRRGALVGVLAAIAWPSMAPNLAAKKKKKKLTFCLNGSTIKASKKRKTSLLKNGATQGACVTTPPPPRSCTGNADCGPGAICHEAFCRTCTVTCTGSGALCGAQLSDAMISSAPVYVCPGRYDHNFVIAEAHVIGAGNGDDPTVDTILDGGYRSNVIVMGNEASRLSLTRLRITGGMKATGSAIYSRGGELTLDDVTVTRNGQAGARNGWTVIYALSTRLTMRNSRITDNNGAGMFLYKGAPGTITNSTIRTNTGGGASFSENAMTIQNTEISANTNDWYGGGLSITDCTVTLDSATRIQNNSTTAVFGGGVSNSGELIQNGATISGNHPDNIYNWP